MKKGHKLPISAVENLMKEKGAERVSDDAREEMRKILEQYLYDLSIKASRIANHSGRKTINEGDILIAKE